MGMDKMKQSFMAEAREILDEMEHLLLEVEKRPDDEEAVNALFRAVHTIKGSSGMFGVRHVEEFTHALESLLDRVRKGELRINAEMTALLLPAHDHIRMLIDLHERGEDDPLDRETSGTGALLAQKIRLYGNEARPEPAAVVSAPPPPDTAPGAPEPDSVKNENWHISLRFNEKVFMNGLDPFPFINYLRGMGEIENCVTVMNALPPAAELDAEKCYLGFEIEFRSGVSREMIESAFEFVKDDCVIGIIPPRSSIRVYKQLIRELPETPVNIGEILVQSGSITQGELTRMLEKQKENEVREGTEARTPLGQILVEEKIAPREVVEAALEKQRQIRTIEEKNRRSMRVDGEKLDQLINFVGELVSAGENVKQLAAQRADADLIESASRMSRLIEQIRENSMNLRMVQIGESFRKFERIVRDYCRESGKEAELVITGAETEVDKTLVEKIGDPLMHIVRNALDHGIGSPDARRARGKNPRGTISLNAFHETGSIVIEVSDDGSGLDRERVYRKALDLGLVQPGQQLSDTEILQLIFRPGFSTAEKVTNISGRGVGMDVVKRNIEALRGVVDVESTPDYGTVVRIRLPLTIAIIDGFMVQVGNLSYVIPLDMVVECIEVSKEDLAGKEGGSFINLRGSVLPFLPMREFLGEKGVPPLRGNIIVVEYGRVSAGLVVDRLLGEFQTVIKPMGKIFGGLDWISGATILGTGEVAFILDVPRLIMHVQSSAVKEGAGV
ncbi:MAG: chemotaxis protein CheA [Spirochaetes bacterium]|nr:MAG: chemotaxis protein CheA [Spirochaetota bacterium]